MDNRYLNVPASNSKLLRLPDTILKLVLQQLDQHSLASLAISCSKFSLAVPAHISKAVARCSNGKDLASFLFWLGRNVGRDAGLTDCSVIGVSSRCLVCDVTVGDLPCPLLEQLHLERVVLDWGRHAMMFYDMYNLQALHLQECILVDPQLASKVIAEFPRLEHLAVEGIQDKQGGCFPITNLGSLTKLTYRSLTKPATSFPGHASGLVALHQRLSQLSALVNLQHLKLSGSAGIPGGLPPQLSKLTCLDLSRYNKGLASESSAETEFQHLSSFTALQQLSIKCKYLEDEGDLCGIEQLSQLTSLTLSGPFIEFSGFKWGGLSALQRLAIQDSHVDFRPLAALTQLRALTLKGVSALHDLLDNHFAGVGPSPRRALLQMASLLRWRLS